MDRLRPDLPNLRGAGGDAPALRLPQLGALHVVESAARGRELLLVDGFGLPVTLLDEASAQGRVLTTFGVDDLGVTALLATDTARVWLVDLTGALAPREVTPVAGVGAVEPGSLRVGPSTAWMVADGRLHRLELGTPGARFEMPAHPLDPTEVLLPELAVSADGDTVAAVSELSSGLRELYAAGAVGPVVRVSEAPSDFDTPSLSGPGGVSVALSDDGACLAWRRTVLVKELFMQRLDVPDSPQQITADSMFADTFDSGTILDFTAEGDLLFAVGESAALDPGTAIGSAEIFVAQMSQPGAPISNLSQTSGDLTVPFLAPGELEIHDIVRVPGSDQMLFDVDPDGGDFQLLLLDPSRPGVLLPVTSPSDFPLRVVPAGSSLLVVEPPSGPLAGRLIQVRADLSPQIVSAIPAGVTLSRFAHDRDDRLAALVASVAPGQEVPVFVNLVQQRVFLAWSLFLPLSEGLGFTREGALALGVGFVAKHGLLVPGAAPKLLQAPTGPALPLAP